MSSWIATFPKGIVMHAAERGELRYEVPIRFVPKLDAEEDGEKATHNKITINDAIEHKVKVYRGGDHESFVRFQLTIREIIKKKELKEEWARFKKEAADAKAAYEALPDPQDDGDTAIADNWLSKIAEAKASQKEIVKEAFNLYEFCLDDNIKLQWTDIVHQHCAVSYEAAQGVLKKRGYNFKTLSECMKLHMVTILPKDAAEIQKHYMRTHVKKPARMTMRNFCNRFLELNGYLQHLPCLKDQQPDNNLIDCAATPFQQTELCSLLLKMVTRETEKRYYSINPTAIPTKFLELRDALERIEVVDGRLEKFRPGKSGSDGKDDKDRPSKESRRERRDRRRREKVKEYDPKERIPKKKKHCNLCKQFGGPFSSHNTSDCNRWARDGTRKGSAQKEANAHKKEENMQFAQFMKATDKTLKKLGKKLDRKKKRKRYDSDSSDSDSE